MPKTLKKCKTVYKLVRVYRTSRICRVIWSLSACLIVKITNQREIKSQFWGPVIPEPEGRSCPSLLKPGD